MRFLPTSEQIARQLPDVPRWLRALARFRFLLAGIYFLTLGGIVVFFVAENTVRSVQDVFGMVIFAAVFFGSQAMLLAGAPTLHRRRPVRRRHIAVSVFAGSAAASLLSFGVIATIVSLLGHKLNWLLPDDSIKPLVLILGGPWLFWAAIFVAMWGMRWGTGFGKMYRLLVAGTFVEIIFTIPVDVLVRRRTSCYCDEGTFYSWIAGGTMALWTFGPGVVLLFLAVRFRRSLPKGVCRNCGYDLRGLPENRCPECGTEFSKDVVPAAV